MELFRRTIALLLLAIWLPATLHCEVEAAELTLHLAGCDESAPSDHSHAALPEDCAVDSCHTVEGGFTSSSSASTAVRAPLLSTPLFVALGLIPSFEISPPPVTGVIEALAAPPEIHRTWMFVTRAAPLPGAPALA